jgi:23S rRNA (pseudouridine1915-N3)-methyltransferase
MHGAQDCTHLAVRRPGKHCGANDGRTMHLHLIAVDRVRERYVAEAVADFRKRLAPYHRLDVTEVKPARGSPADVMTREAEAILAHVAPGATLWLLEREGVQLASEEIAGRLEALALSGTPRLTLAIGGAFGNGAALRERADFAWSLSRLTLLHEWARALVLEQLYRATKIARNEPYHN